MKKKEEVIRMMEILLFEEMRAAECYKANASLREKYLWERRAIKQKLDVFLWVLGVKCFYETWTQKKTYEVARIITTGTMDTEEELALLLDYANITYSND